MDLASITINTTKNISKLQVIENEFKRAELMEIKMQKEEEEVRKAVRKKKLNNLEKSRRTKRVLMIKEDRKTKKEISEAIHNCLRPTMVGTHT